MLLVVQQKRTVVSVLSRFVTRKFPSALQHGVLAAFSLCLSLDFSIAWGYQSGGIQREEPELIDQEPFDLITLTREAGGDSVKVFPLPFPNRVVPSNPRETDRLRVILVEFPEREYEVLWKNIEKIELYEKRVYLEAIQRMDAEDYIGAFQNLSYLLKEYPKMEGLQSLQQQFLLRSAGDKFKSGNVAQTVSALEELRRIAPNFNASTVTRGLSRAADTMIQAYQAAGDLTSAKALLARLEKEYGDSLPVVGTWRGKLEQMARAKMADAQRLMARGEYRKARQAAVDMLGILPDFQEGIDLIDEINRKHPMVRVGVMQRSGELNPSSLVNWPARRAGALVALPLLRFLDTGSEGGKYEFAMGQLRFSDDRRQLSLTIKPDRVTQLDAFGLAQELLRRGQPGDKLYDSAWASVVDSVVVKSASEIVVSLKRPNVLPAALMQWVLKDEEGGYSLPGSYEVAGTDEVETSFRIRMAEAQSGQPIEIVEVFYDDPRAAVNDLLRGEIDVLDQLYPADARLLSADPRLTVAAYALPSTHMLLPVSDDPFLANSKFRRALMYATNRQAMLEGELLNSKDQRDGRLLSGPFPIGDGQTDLLAYAYDAEIDPIGYSPELARLLVVMAEDEVAKAAVRKRESPPERKTLLVGCPDYEFARVAVQGMIQQWDNIGVKVEMQVLPPGELFSSEVECDLLYVIAAMWEPVTDIERLLGYGGIVASEDPYIVQGLEELRASSNWREVRDALRKLHRLVDYHLPVLPLWQVTDRFVFRKNVRGLKDRPVSLYENVAAWRINHSLTERVGQ